MLSRQSLTYIFLWLSIVTWGIGTGAKLFDLVVVASAWGAAPPASLALYPYGRSWPIDPGNFFQPLSALMLVVSLGALIAGWRTQPSYKLWLWLPIIAFTLIWIATPTVFWPIINELYQIAHGRITRSNAEMVALIHRWVVGDWLRVATITAGFLSAIRAISLPYRERDRE